MKKRTLALLLTWVWLLVGLVTAQSKSVSASPEFLNVRLGKPLAEQFPECKRYDAVKEMNHTDHQGFRCYDKDLGYVFDHDIGSYEAKDWDAYKTALVHTQTDSDTNNVGYVGTDDGMDSFQETFALLIAKRGHLTKCRTPKVQNLMGASMKQIHCEWKQTWGSIVMIAPSDDDLTRFDVWAVTTHHIQLQKQEDLAQRKKVGNKF